MLTEKITQRDIDECVTFLTGRGEHVRMLHSTGETWHGMLRMKASDGLCYFQDGTFDPTKTSKYDLISRIPKEPAMGQVTVKDERNHHDSSESQRLVCLDYETLFTLADEPKNVFLRFYGGVVKLTGERSPVFYSAEECSRGGMKLMFDKCVPLPHLHLDLVLRNKE